MDVTASLTADVGPEVLYDVVADLGGYPQWLESVPRADPVDTVRGDTGPAWSVDLRGRVGPLSRSKRLRMVRTRHEPPNLAVFERRELDGRHHSDWILRAAVRSEDARTSTLTMELHYGGTMWVPLLDRLLAEEIERSIRPVLALIATAG